MHPIAWSVTNHVSVYKYATFTQRLKATCNNLCASTFVFQMLDGSSQFSCY